MSFYSNSRKGGKFSSKEKAKNIHMTNSMHRGGVRSSYAKSRIGSAFLSKRRGNIENMENTSAKPIRPTTALSHKQNTKK